MLAFAFVLAQVGASAGCNAILDNGYGVDDTVGASPDGSGGDGAAGGGDGGSGADGMTTGDGSLGDANNADGGAPILLAAVGGPQRLALSTTGLYWASLAGIGRIDLNGGNLKEVKITQPIGANLKRGIAVNPAGTAAYVTMPGGTKGAARCAADLSSCSGGFIGSAGDASSIAVDGSHVHVGIFDDQLGAAAGGIWYTDPDGLNAKTYTTAVLLTDKVLDLQIVGATTYFRTPDAIRAATLTGLPATVMTLTTGLPVAFVVTGTKVFVATSTGLLQTCTLSLPAACTGMVVQLTAGTPSAMTADATRVYWVERDKGTVHRCDIADCANSHFRLASGQTAPNDIVVDGASVYWANYGDAAGLGGAIMKLPK